MTRRKHKPEEIVAKLRQVDVLTSQGRSVAEAVRTIDVTEVSFATTRRRDFIYLGGSQSDHRKLASLLQ